VTTTRQPSDAATIGSPDTMTRGFAESQLAGLAAMISLAEADGQAAGMALRALGYTLGDGNETASVRLDDHDDLDSYTRRRPDYAHPRGVAAREACRGALTDEYDIPDVAVRPVRRTPYALLAIAVAIVGLARHADFISIYERYGELMASWLIVFVLALAQWALSLRERPYKGWSRRLDTLHVVVSLPVYNEDPPTLDRVLYSLACQTRLPDVVHVVDDGSSVSYQQLRDHWERDPVLGPRLMWTRQPNAGKKHAQAACFTAHPAADIFVTLDSDTTLTRNAIEEGLRPFTARDVYSVAGLELAWNHSKNWLTLMSSTRTLSWQLLSCAAQNVAGGDVTVNRGTFALYRAGMIRDIIPAYLGETFLGHKVKLGDDAALTLFAECRGRAVQQPTAVCLAMYPESLRHHFKQWTRWMRGSTIRTCWRLRYLRLTSYTWWFTLLSTWSFTASIGATVVAAITWPQSETYAAAAALAMIAWAVLVALRTTTVRRSDQNWLDRLIVVLMAPMTAFWVAFVLRPARIYGIATFLRQGWITRSQVEIVTSPPPGGITVSMAVESR
jgi:hyaluronan synthase